MDGIYHDERSTGDQARLSITVKEMPVVEVYLHTILQRHTSQGIQKQLEINLPPFSTVADLIRILQIELDLDHLLLVVNGRVVDENYTLGEGDKVNLMPALSGGIYFSIST